MPIIAPTKIIRLLVIDDRKPDFEYLINRLQETDRYLVEWTANAEEGLAALHRSAFDILLVDHRPGLGSERKFLRETSNLGIAAPIILLVESDEAEAEAAAAPGVADCLCKAALDPVRLECSIRYAMRHAQVLSALRESQNRLELFMRHVPCAVCIRDEQGRVLFSNEQYKEHFKPGMLDGAEQNEQENVSRQFDLGERHWIINSFPLIDSAGRRLQGLVAINVTARVRAQEQLRRTTCLLNSIFASLPVVAIRVDESGIISDSWGHGLALMGTLKEEMVGKDLRHFSPQGGEAIKKAMAGQSGQFLSSIERGGQVHYFDNYFQFDEASGSGAIGFSVNVTARLEAEIARKSQGQLLAGIMNNMPIIVGRLDRGGRVIEAEGQGLASRGMAPARLAGQRLAELYPEAGDAIDRAIGGAAAGCAIRGRDEDEEWHVEFFAFPDASEMGAAVFFGRDVTTRKHLERSLLSISDAEQRRIGADLHDGLGQQLTGTACLATVLRDQLTAIQSPQAAQAAKIAAHINAAIDMTRGLARGLCPVQVENGGLSAALEDFSCHVQHLHGIKCRFNQIGPRLFFEPHVATHLYRIAQEAINNVLRHSSADEVLITLGSTGARPFLVIEDNGPGFDPASLPSTRGLGLRLMDYRAAMIGGTFKVSRKTGGGMRVECAFSRYETDHLTAKTEEPSS
ncbi:MAG: PAS domain-containing protein [Verrucomicrobiota bacterium]|nr:PAS domain-containing protein [Verrucomicrobiota bacterium]